MEIFNLGLVGFIVGFAIVKKFLKNKRVFNCITGGFLLMSICILTHLVLIRL
jgi:hypothetical protein